MAYPTVDAPYGLKPVNLIGGLPFAGATRQIPIGNAYPTSIFNGDVVQLNSSGNVIITTLQNNVSAVNGVIGVFLGCSFTNPTTKQKQFSQYYPASTAADDIMAYISDDPNALYKVVNVASNVADSTSGGLLPTYLSRANSFGTNAELVLNTGLTNTGNSRMGVFINNVTSALPFRVVDVVTDSANSSGNFVEFIVKFNAGYHAYNNASGT
jgi:hypothetical protein